jgi:hypothetical protein
VSSSADITGPPLASLGAAVFTLEPGDDAMTTATKPQTIPETPTAGTLEAATERLTAAERAARSWLTHHAETHPDAARAELLGHFGGDLCGSRLNSAEHVRDELDRALAEATAIVAGAPRFGQPPPTGPAPTTWADLKAREAGETDQADARDHGRILRAAIASATPVVPILREATMRYATVMLATQRDILADQHASAAEAMRRTLAGLRQDHETFQALVARWGLTLGTPLPVAELVLAERSPSPAVPSPVEAPAPQPPRVPKGRSRR